MREKLLAFIDSLIDYDYMLFGAIVLIFFLLIIFALMLRKKVGLSAFIIIFAFIFLFVGPYIGYKQMHKYVFKHELSLTSEKKLQFVSAVVVFGKLKNTSNLDFRKCEITAIANKQTSNKLKNFIYSFKPISKMSIVEEDIVIGNEIDFKIIIEPFNYSNDYNISLKAHCL